MSLLRKSRQGLGRLLHQTYVLDIAIAVLLFAGSHGSSSAQLPPSAAPPPAAKPAAPVDPLGRQTPRSSLMGFLKYQALGDYATAARFLQLSWDQNPVELTKELRTLYPNFESSINLLSDDPNGTVETGLSPGQVSAGVITVDGKTANLIMVRVDDPAAGRIWLISQDTLAVVPDLYARLGREAPTQASRIRLALSGGPIVLGMSSTKWLCWLFS